MSTWLVRADFNDNIIGDMDIQQYLEKTDQEIIDVAETFAVGEGSIVDPLPYKIKEWAKAWLLREFCLDKSGTNNLQAGDMDKYLIKHHIYEKKEVKLKKQITEAMFTGNVSGKRDRAVSSGILFRS